MVRGLYRTQKWLYSQPAERIAEVVKPYFPNLPEPLMRAAIARYQGLGIWGRNPVLPRGGYDRLKDGLISAGFAKGVPFETAVDNSLAENAVRADPPPLQ
jgi:NitT/TauT family transport system substrate-binding protein